MMRANESKIAAALRNGHTMQAIRSMPWDEFLKVTGSEPREIAVKNKNGTTYACLDVAYWDPELHVSTHRRKTIGYYDESGKLILTGSSEDTRKRTAPKPEVYAEIQEIGRTLLFSQIAKRTRLLDVVSSVFGKNADAIMTCVYYIAGHNGALCHCEQWSAGSDNPVGQRMTDQRISELLRCITVDQRARFFAEWIKILGDDDNYALDITSISSYSDLITIIKAGYNRDKEDLEQVNLALLIGSRSRLPASYSILPGNINDKTSLKAFLHRIKAMGFGKFSIVMDKGFYSRSNVDELYDLKQRFLIGIENRIDFVKEYINEVRKDIQSFDNYYDNGASKVYCVSKRIRWECSGGEGHRCFVHIFYDPRKKEDDDRHFIDKLNKVRTGIMEGDSAYTDSAMAGKYFTVSKSKGKIIVKADQKKIDERNEYSGYLVLLSNHIHDPKEALRIYREKETAESAFDDMKNNSDMNRLRVHSEDAIESKVFLVFLSLILKLEMSNVMLNDPVLRSKSRTEIIEEMAILRRTKIGKSTVYSERTKLQKRIISAFGIEAPFKDTVEQ